MSRLNLVMSVAMALPATTAVVAQNSQQPNILIILTDDQGYNDLSCMGSTMNYTPVLDGLAERGTLYTNFYAQHVSGASRAALLSGRYPLRSGARSFPISEVTFAEMAKEKGYQTACIGKWELSDRQEIVERMPLAQGFDYYYGTLGGNDGGKIWMYENNEKDQFIEDMGQVTRLYTDKAIDFVENQLDGDKPFVLYVAHTMLHSVVGASPEYIGTSQGGLYGDALQELDAETGRLLNSIEEMGYLDNTLIIYTTDNGPWSQPKYRKRAAVRYGPGEIFWGNSAVLRDGKGSAYEGGSRVPCIISWPGRVPQGVRKDGLMSTLDFVPTFAAAFGWNLRNDVIIDGVDQSKLIFTKSDKSARETFCYMHVGTVGKNLSTDFVAIRDQRWKLLIPGRKIEKHGFLTDFGTNDYELYDLQNDMAEQNNVIDQYPKEAARLKQMYVDMKYSFDNEK